MTIARWDPFGEGLRLRDAMNRLFEESVVRPATFGTGEGFGLPLDLEESQDGYTVRASLPGFKPEDVNISVTGDTLTIRAEHKGEEEQKGRNYLLRERRFGSVTRSVTLPTRLQADQAEARYENGELILTLPKAEEVKPRQIQISSGGKQQLGGGSAEQGGEQQVGQEQGQQQ